MKPRLPGIVSKTILAKAAMVFVLAGAAAAATDVIDLRQQGMNANKDAMKAINATLRQDGSLADVATAAGRIAAFVKTLPTLFPPGSDVGAKNSAGPAIWTDPKGFAAAAAKAGDAATALQQAALSGDKAAVQTRFAAMGDACKSCHDKYEKE